MEDICPIRKGVICNHVKLQLHIATCKSPTPKGILRYPTMTPRWMKAQGGGI